MIAHGTRVIWEEASPNGPCYDNVLCEGRAIDADCIGADWPTGGWIYVTESSNALSMIKLKDCRTMSVRRLVY